MYFRIYIITYELKKNNLILDDSDEYEDFNHYF